MIIAIYKTAQRCILLLSLTLMASQVWSATYTANTETFNWIDPATHTNVVWTAAPSGPANECSGFSISIDDDISQALALGFDFSFGGVNYNSVRIMSNGRIQFNNSFCGHGTAAEGPPRTYPFPMPHTSLNNALRIYGADLDPGAGGSVRYASLGSAPNRYFVITWSNVREWGFGASNFNLQIILHESGEFVYQYGALSNPTLGQAQIGWQINNSDYQLYEYSTITALQNSALRFSSYTPAPLAYYAMDSLSWNGTANEVQDSSGNNRHGDRVGGAQTINPGYVCRGAHFPGNNDGVDTKVNVNTVIGNRGTITFWYNSDSAWSSGNAMLTDASNNLGNNTADKTFFLVKLTQGRLRFHLESSNDRDLFAQTPNNNFAAGTWHHITMTWDLVTDADWLQIYVDGTRQVVNRGNLTSPIANVNNALGNLDTLYLGLNRTNGVSDSGYSNSSADGVLDEARIYSDVLSPAQITADINQTHACLLGAWNMDENTWNGTGNEVIDSSGNNHHGTAINGALTATGNPAIAGNPGTCRYGEFDGNDDYIALPGFPNLTDSFTITAWINPTVVGSPQRIFIDDESNSGGYGFSLNDGGSGRLRFYTRSISPVILDTPAIIAPGNWYHVAAVHDAISRTRQIFVNGVAVTAAQSYTGSWGIDNGTASIGGETNNAGSETNSYIFTGSIDETRVYGRAMNAADITSVMNEARPCAITFDHLRIEHDGTALTCEPENVTVRACLNASCSSEYLGAVALTLSPTGWTGGDSKVVTGGSTAFILPRTTAGTVALGISAPSPSPNNGVQCLNTATNAADCNLTFYDTGFIYTIPTQTSCATSNNITISAVRLDNTSQACVPTFVSQTRNVVFSLNYANPITGTRDLSLNYNATNYTPIDDTSSQTVPVSFDVNGQANFTVTYPDAGQITLNSQYNGSAGTGDAGLVMNGAATFINKPYKLYVHSDDANSDCAGASATCSAFTQAGNVFNLKVRAACSDNSVTPNFQLSGLTMTHLNIAPAIAQGTLGVNSFNVIAADNGEHTITNQSVSEVGAFSFTAALPVGGYFGETFGDAALNTSATLGRFYPSHFCIGANMLFNRTDANSAAGCTDAFSYLDEEFSVNVPISAHSFASGCGAGGITQNYTGAWSKFTSPFSEDTTLPAETGKWNFAAVNSPAASPLNLNSRLSINTATSSGSFSNGQATINAIMNVDRAGITPSYTAELPLADTHIGFNPVDTDNVSIDSTNLLIGTDNYRDIGTTALFFGRLFAENAFGSNQADIGLDMFARTEYCSAISGINCTQWLHKTDDSCTLYNINPPAGTALGFNASNIGTPGYYQRASATITSSVFDFTNSGAATNYARVHVPDTSDHSAGWRLFYTAGGNGGDFTIPFLFPFNIDPAIHPYLLDVDGIASFGQFRGDDRIIHWREVLE